MKQLYDKIFEIFPGSLSSLNPDNIDLPYVVMGELVDWLQKLSKDQITPEIIQRVVDFSHWCEESPKGESAGDDLYTIWVVAFFEDLFRAESTRILIPKLTTKEEMISNAEYLKSWVKIEDYEAALRLFP